MSTFKHVGKASFFIEGDETASEYQSDVIEWQGALWFVATRLLHIATNTPIPKQLVPMAKLNHTALKDGHCRLGTLIPKEFAEDRISLKQLRAFGVVDAPGLVHTQGPKSVH